MASHPALCADWFSNYPHSSSLTTQSGNLLIDPLAKATDPCENRWICYRCTFSCRTKTRGSIQSPMIIVETYQRTARISLWKTNLDHIMINLARLDFMKYLTSCCLSVVISCADHDGTVEISPPLFRASAISDCRHFQLLKHKRCFAIWI